MNDITASDILRRQEAVDKKIEKFFRNYEVNVENDMRRRHVRRYPAQYFVDPHDASICASNVYVKEEKLYTISIPESRLKALVEMEDRVSRYVHEPGGMDLLADLMHKEREEATLRAQNEGIAKAYEQYSMLLHLAGYQRRF